MPFVAPLNVFWPKLQFEHVFALGFIVGFLHLVQKGKPTLLIWIVTT
jgi:hypothetical protein